MNTLQSLVLPAVVLAISACASSAANQQPAAAPGEMQSVAKTLVALSTVAPQPSALADPPLVRDPWEGFNRRMHGLNNVLDRFVLRPVAVAYDDVVPEFVQAGVSRFFGNLRMPATALNQAMQGRPAHAGHSLGRFLVNTTVGIAGVFDPATRFGIPEHEAEDLGQTLATWGWRDSRYLVMPVMGPRTVRDAVGSFGAGQMSPVARIGNSSIADKLRIAQMVDGRARSLPLDQARKNAVDDYIFVRDAWAQRRNRQVEQGLRSIPD